MSLFDELMATPEGAEQLRLAKERYAAKIKDADRERWRKNDAEKQYSKKRKERVMTETRAKATQHYAHWSAAELLLLADESLDAHQIALMTGRTYYAVQNRRRKLQGKRDARGY